MLFIYVGVHIAHSNVYNFVRFIHPSIHPQLLGSGRRGSSFSGRPQNSISLATLNRGDWEIPTSRHSQFTLTAWWVYQACPDALHQMVISWQLCPSPYPIVQDIICGLRSDDTITKSIVNHQPRVLWYTYEHPNDQICCLLWTVHD